MGAAIYSYVAGVCVFWFFNGEMDGQPIEGVANLFWLLLAIGFLLAAILSWADYLYNRVGKKAHLTIVDDGIDDGSSIYSMGMISWQEIKGFEIKQKLGINRFFVYLKDPKKYISAQALWKRLILIRWLKRFGSPVIISQRRFSFDIQKLKNLLEQRKAAYLN